MLRAENAPRDVQGLGPVLLGGVIAPEVPINAAQRVANLALDFGVLAEGGADLGGRRIQGFLNRDLPPERLGGVGGGQHAADQKPIHCLGLGTLLAGVVAGLACLDAGLLGPLFLGGNFSQRLARLVLAANARTSASVLP